MEKQIRISLFIQRIKRTGRLDYAMRLNENISSKKTLVETWINQTLLLSYKKGQILKFLNRFCIYFLFYYKCKANEIVKA